jgi:MerR family transcriptional regulator/heat shock protein HspR
VASVRASQQTAGGLPQRVDHDAPIFVISVAAQLAGMHPQTLRTYDRMGLVSPRRTAKRGRRYSARNIARLRLIQRLSQDEGINLEGIRRILHMQDEIDELRARVNELSSLLATVRSAPPGSRVFTADPAGDVHLGRTGRMWSTPRAITSH